MCLNQGVDEWEGLKKEMEIAAWWVAREPVIPNHQRLSLGKAERGKFPGFWGMGAWKEGSL